MSRSCLWLALALAACSKKAVPPADKPALASASAHRDEPEHEGLPSKVRLAETVIRAAHVEVAPVLREALVVTLSLPGELVADPDKSARVAAPVAGRLERVEFKEGSLVKKGDLLAVIKIPELGKLRAEGLSLQARARAARANAERLRSLQAQRFAAEQDVLNAEAEARSLEEEASGIQQQLTAIGGGSASTLVLRAPISGTVLSRDAIVGQPISTERVIASIADLSELWFSGRVFEKDLGRLQNKAAGEVVLNAYPHEVFHGNVEYIGKQIEPGSRTVTARIRLTNRNELLRVGLFGSARVATNERQGEVLVVPSPAVTEVAGKQAVFVRQSDGDFELHPVTLGRVGSGKVEVLSGLREGEQVVIDGVFALKSAVLRGTFAEED